MTPAESSWPQPADPDAVPPPAPTMAAAPSILRKNPWLALLLSGFPGLGNLYNGLYLRAFVQFLLVAGLLGAVDRSHSGPFYPMALVFFWAFNALDAFRQAMLINYGYSQDLGLLDRPKRPGTGQGGLVAGIILTLLGTVALLDQYFNIDLRWLYDLWPVSLILVGIWLVVASLRERAKAAQLSE